MDRTVHVVGSVNEDLRLRVEAPPRPGETVVARDAVTELGGKGANQAVAARRAGARVRFVGAVGGDVTGAGLRDGLAAEGIDVSGLRAEAGSLTGRAIVTVSATGQNQIVLVPGANATVDAARAGAELSRVRPGEIVVLQLELPLATVAAAAATARRRGGFVVVNAAPVDAGVLSVMDDVDVLVVNEPELAALASAAGVRPGSSAAVAERLASAVDVAVLCTLGGAGSLLVGQGRSLAQQAFDVDVVDTTGAGDTFIGYLAAGLARSQGWAEVLYRASVAAAVAVSREGAARSIPVPGELPDDPVPRRSALDPASTRPG